MKVSSIVALLALASFSNAFAPNAMNARGSTTLSMGLKVGESFPKDAVSCFSGSNFRLLRDKGVK
jgi:hypothetical protein